MRTLIGAVSALALGAIIGTPALATDSIEAGARYVALGSSFAAGASIGPNQEGSPDRCYRSVNNYPSLVAEALGLALEDQSCSSATTAHVLGPWDELPAQIDAVTEDTRLVTITIGGNDLSYVGNLMNANCEAGEPTNLGGIELTCAAEHIPDDADFAAAEASMREIAEEVHERAPQAKLIFVQYHTLVPDELCPAVEIPDHDAELARTTAARLSEITNKVAEETGSEVIPMDELSAAHTACDAEPWANGDGDETYDLSKGAPWHPNAAGHKATADAIMDLLG